MVCLAVGTVSCVLLLTNWPDATPRNPQSCLGTTLCTTVGNRAQLIPKISLRPGDVRIQAAAPEIPSIACSGASVGAKRCERSTLKAWQPQRKSHRCDAE